MLIKSSKGSSTLSLILLSFTLQLLLIVPGLAETSTLERQGGGVATSLPDEAPCNAACPVWVSGVDGQVCDSVSTCPTLGLDATSPTATTPPETTTQPAEDQFLKPMRFAVVRSSSRGCEPSCPEWITASGKITSNSPREFRKLLRTLGKRRLPVVLESPGGDVNAAMVIGRMIRKRGMDVAVGKTGFDGCTVAQTKCGSNRYADGAMAGFPAQGNAYCFSACPFILAGGVRRLAGTWSQIGVHQVTSSLKTPFGPITAPETDDSFRHELMAYFKEMGTDPWIVDRMFATPTSDISVLSYLEMATSKIITETGDVMSAHICGIM